MTFPIIRKTESHGFAGRRYHNPESDPTFDPEKIIRLACKVLAVSSQCVAQPPIWLVY